MQQKSTMAHMWWWFDYVQNPPHLEEIESTVTNLISQPNKASCGDTDGYCLDRKRVAEIKFMEIIYIALLTLVGTTIGTITGFGTSTIMIPVVVIFLPPVEAIFLVAIIHYFGDIWKLALFREGFNLRLVALFGVVGLLPSYVGASMSLGVDKEMLLRLLGVFLAAYFVFLVFQSKFKIGAGNAMALLGGVFAGFSSGLFGIGGPIRSAVLSAFDLPKAVYIATGAVIGLMVDAARIIRYFVGGTPLPNHLW